MALCLQEDFDVVLRQYGEHGAIVRLSYMAEESLKRVSRRENEEPMVENPNEPVLMEIEENKDEELQFATKCHEVLLHYLKKTSNTRLYRQANESLDKIAPHLVPLDRAWLEATEKQNTAKIDMLEHSVNQAKIAQNTSGIVAALMSLAHFALDRGEYTTALQTYIKVREYHANDALSLALLKTNAFMRDYPEVHSYALKLRGDYAAVGEGLFFLATGDYRKSALAFRNIQGINDDLNDVLTLSDVCVYISLLALASFDRKELNALFEDNNYQERLTMLPSLHSIVLHFVECRYGSALEELAVLSRKLCFDIHLGCHIDAIRKEIRKTAITRFFVPFDVVSLKTFGNAFGGDIRDEVEELIAAGKMSAKIDAARGVVVSRHPCQRAESFKNSLAVGDDILESTKTLILRWNLLKVKFKSDEVVNLNEKYFSNK